jgi:hypothetical protein
MNRGQRALINTLLLLVAVFTTGLGYILGALPLKMLRRGAGRTGFWSMTLLVSMGLLIIRTAPVDGIEPLKYLGLSFLSLVFLVGVLEEFEEMGFGLIPTVFFTMLINVMLSVGAFALWLYCTGAKWDQTLLAYAEESIRLATAITPNVQINAHDFMLQLPSILIVGGILTLYVSILFDRRSPLRAQLGTFQLPDACMWTFIAALLGSQVDFHSHALQVLSTNVLAICAVLWFLQGAGVAVKMIERMNMGVIWQVLFVAMFVIQLPVVTLIGILDYWFNFRTRWARREQMNREI